MRGLLGLLVLSIAVLSCAPTETAPPRDAEADRAAIRAGNEAWLTTFNSGNREGLAAVYASDAILYPPGSPPVAGREAITGAFGGMIDAGISGEIAVEETEVSGPLGYQIGSFVLTAADGGLVDEGHFVEIWGLEDGRWVMRRDIFNSDLPPAGATEQPAEEPDE